MGHVTLPTLPSGQFNLSLASSCHDPPPHQTGSVSLPVPGIGGGHKCHLTVPTPPQGAFYLSLARTCHSPSTNKIWSVSLHPFERCGCPKFKKVGHWSYHCGGDGLTGWAVISHQLLLKLFILCYVKPEFGETWYEWYEGKEIEISLPPTFT